MVRIITVLIGAAALLSQRALAAPVPDSNINDPAVEAPNGTPVTLSADLPVKTGDADIQYIPSSTYNSGYSTSSSDGYYGGGTTTYSSSYSTSTMYGSGHYKWNSGYNNCVQQCMNTHGPPPSMYTPPPSRPSKNDGGKGGSGNVHTVIVAPAQGILRFVPFAVNASVGDTIHYVWGGSPHTVTKSSILTPCNKSSESPDFFASGIQNKSFTFDITVNSTSDPIVYYCGVPGHCPKGMFGFINPPNAFGAGSTVTNMMPALIASNPTFATQAMYTANVTHGSSAENWGDNMDMSQVPPSMQQTYLENVMMTRLLFAMNPGMLEGGKGAANPDGSLITIPSDISQITGALASGEGNSSSSNAVPNSTTPKAASSASSAAASATTSARNSGAVGRSVGSVGAIGAMAILVSVFAL